MQIFCLLVFAFFAKCYVLSYDNKLCKEKQGKRRVVEFYEIFSPLEILYIDDSLKNELLCMYDYVVFKKKIDLYNVIKR